jgi:hypothetical protein
VLVGGLGVEVERNGHREVCILFNVIFFVAMGQRGSLPIKTNNA